MNGAYLLVDPETKQETIVCTDQRDVKAAVERVQQKPIETQDSAIEDMEERFDRLFALLEKLLATKVPEKETDSAPAPRKKSLRDEIRDIRDAARRTVRLSESGVGAGEFHRRLMAANESYAAYAKQSDAGKAFEEESKRAGQVLQARFSPKPKTTCVTDDAPVRPHQDASEDFTEQAREARRKLLGRV